MDVKTVKYDLSNVIFKSLCEVTKQNNNIAQSEVKIEATKETYMSERELRIKATLNCQP